MQPVDFTTLAAACAELRADWLPARFEQAVQCDRTTLSLALRTLKQRAWLTISWHPQAARLHIGEPPPKGPDTFTFSQQIKHQLGGLALVSVAPISPWERALDLQFAQRPGDPVQWHLYVEIMGKYSNVILATAENQIVTAAHQVSEQQSSVRPIQTGQPYLPPPRISNPFPRADEPQADWQRRISLIPGPLKSMMLKTYGGLSAALAAQLAIAADLDPSQSTDSLSAADWTRLFQRWQDWLRLLDKSAFVPGWTAHGYTVIGFGLTEPVDTVQELLATYYRETERRQQFDRLHNQLSQKVKGLLNKLRQKAATFATRLDQSDQADEQRQRADLLMAYQHQWQPGLKQMTLADFTTGEPVTIPLNPEKNAVQNAQALYKQHQKLKRARLAVEPLLRSVKEEVDYLEQVEAALLQTTVYETAADLGAIAQIRDELIQQGYLPNPDHRPSREADDLPFHRFLSPQGHEIWIGRNNRQNDQLTFRTATDYDLWFHSQEIPGSHVLLRLDPGAVPSDEELQYVADLAAYFSRARQSDQVPVVYTEPKHVYKPNRTLPGMVIYKHERVLWGQPQQAKARLTATA